MLQFNSEPDLAWLLLPDLATTAEAAYKQAVHNIFVRKEEVHRFSMPNNSRKHPGKARWTLFEMWPISVSPQELVTASDKQCCFSAHSALSCPSLLGNLRLGPPVSTLYSLSLPLVSGLLQIIMDTWHEAGPLAMLHVSFSISNFWLPQCHQLDAMNKLVQQAEFLLQAASTYTELNL